MGKKKKLAEVQQLKDVFNLDELIIPEYQRPYKWSLKHVNQLLDDLLFHMDKGVSRYRVGTVVLHRETQEDKKEAFNIVDGQQRLVTFSLILYALCIKGKTSFLSKAFEQLKSNTISCVNLQNNYVAIKQRIDSLTTEKNTKLQNFILKHCEFVVVTLDNISEAFQFFDSQNARGKGLEPYDLLKAFHLREMDGNTEYEKLACVKQWEQAIQDKALKPLFNEYLFRIRKWVRGESAFYFTKDDIDVFKGISTSELSSYPYLQSYHVVDGYVANNASKPIIQVNFPFHISQVILNGKRFFEYVEHYHKLLHTVKQHDHEVFTMLNNYKGRHRTGDLYTRNLFQAALLYYVDRFGMTNMEQAVKTCFRWAYTIRLGNIAVRLATMDNKALEQKSMFKVMPYALHPNEVLNYPYTVVTKNKATNVEKIAEYYGITKQGNES